MCVCVRSYSHFKHNKVVTNHDETRAFALECSNCMCTPFQEGPATKAAAGCFCLLRDSLHQPAIIHGRQGQTCSLQHWKKGSKAFPIVTRSRGPRPKRPKGSKQVLSQIQRWLISIMWGLLRLPRPTPLQQWTSPLHFYPKEGRLHIQWHRPHRIIGKHNTFGLHM